MIWLKFPVKLWYLRLKLAAFDIRKCIWLWRLYLKYFLTQRRYEPKETFHSDFKASANFSKIRYNTALESGGLLHRPTFPFFENMCQKPIHFFYRFPDKDNNIRFNDSAELFSEKPKLQVIDIKPFTYYEGVTFNNIVFKNFALNKLCFHNCVFYDCDFVNIHAPISIDSSFNFVYGQGFSACNFERCHFKNCKLASVFFSIGSLSFTTFENISFYNCMFHRISFEYVKFEGKTILNKTSILSPSHRFEISFSGPVENISVDANCKITEFCYRDIVNFSIERYKSYRVSRKETYKKIADTYYTLDQIWASNHIREEDNHRANLYYQRKKAETRSKNGLPALFGYLSEWTIGYGEKPFRAFVSIAVLILLFSFIYMFTGFTPDSSSAPIIYVLNYNSSSIYQIFSDWFQSLFYSFFTLITVGQGSAAPASIATQVAMAVELLCGSILMTLFTATLFRKYTK